MGKAINKIFAAYDLGLTSMMVRYNARYYIDFPWDPRAAGGRSIHECLKWINEDLLALMPAIRAEAARKVAGVVGDLQTHLTRLRLRGGLGRAEPRYRRDVERARNLWKELSSYSSSALRDRPNFYPWYRIGRSAALCFLDLLNEDRKRILPSLARLVRDAAALPDAHRQKVEVLRRLAAHKIDDAWKTPLTVLNEVLGERTGPLETYAPLVAVITKVDRMERAIQAALAAGGGGLTFEVHLDDPRQPYVILDHRRPYPVNDTQAKFLCEVEAAGGQVLGGPAIVQKHPELQDVNLSQERSRLHPDLKSLIGTRKGRRGGGYFWRG